jgi:hypothetical protein
MARRPLCSGRLLTGGLLLGAVGAALAPAGPDALVPFKLAIASAADDVYVAVIVDFGTGSGMSSISKCVLVPSGSTDSAALAAAVGQSNVAYGSTGLLCSIDGYPSDGVQNCNRTSGSQYYFWSYWHGATGSWLYSNDGPAEHAATDGDVQGWRFENPGPASPSAPQPEVAPNYAAICGVHTPATTTTTLAPAPTPTSTSTTAVTSVAGGPAPTTTTTARRSAPATTTTTTSSTTSTIRPTSSTSSTSPPHSTATSGASGNGNGNGHHVASADTASHRPSGSSGGAWLPIVLVGVLVVALGLVAFWRARRRPAQE